MHFVLCGSMCCLFGLTLLPSPAHASLGGGAAQPYSSPYVAGVAETPGTKSFGKIEYHQRQVQEDHQHHPAQKVSMPPQVSSIAHSRMGSKWDYIGV